MPIDPIQASRPVVEKTPDQLDLERKASIHQEAMERFRYAMDSLQEERQLAMDAFNFNSGNHMDAQEKARRLNGDGPKRPVIELNRTGPAIKRVVNTYRQSPPEGKVIPYGENASKEAAQILQGYVRTMNNISSANTHKEIALEDAAIGGIAWIGLQLEYEQKTGDFSGPEAFYMRPSIRSFETPFQNYRDPSAKEFLFVDQRFHFVETKIPKAVFKQKYPHAESNNGWFVASDIARRDKWFTEQETRVVEYWYVTSDQMELALLPDRSVVPKDKVPEGIIPINSRIVEVNRKVHQAIMDGAEVLEESEWPGSIIPIIPYIGDRYIEHGIRKIRGMVTKTAMAANLLLDYCVTRLAEVLGLMPLSPLMVAFESIPSEFEEAWRTANTEMHSFLPYMAYDEEGRQLPRPARESTSPEVQGIIASIGVAIDAIKAEMDTYDASLGNQGTDASGKQTALRQAASELGHFHIIDDAARAEELLTWMLVELAPKLFNRDGILKITDPDQSMRDVVTIPNQLGNPSMAIKPTDGSPLDPAKIFEINPQEYAFTVTVGKNYETKREERNLYFMDILRLVPGMAPQLLPTILRSSDTPDADKLADILDPQKQEELPPAAQAKINELQGLVQQLTAALNKQAADAQQKQLDRDSNERIEALKGSIQLFEIEMKAGIEQFKQTLLMASKQIRDMSTPGVGQDQSTSGPPEAQGGSPAPAAPTPAPEGAQ